MAKKPVETVPEEPFDEDKYIEWAMTVRAHNLAEKINRTMNGAKTPFDGMCASLRLLGVTPSFEVIFVLLIINDHVARFLAREDRLMRKLQRKLGVKRGGKLAVP